MNDRSHWRAVGQSLPRLEAVDKATGRGVYTGDVRLPGMLHARLVRSSYAHGRVVSLKTERALAVPGVRLVLSAANVSDHFAGLPRFDTTAHRLARDGAPLPGDQALFDSLVRYVGQPLAAVLADTDDAARQGAESVEVEYDELPALIRPLLAIAPGAAVIHQDAPGNIVGEIKHRKGDPEGACAKSALVLEKRFRTGRQKHAQLEPTCCVAEPEADGSVTLWSPSQSPHRIARALANLFGLDPAHVRVRTPLIGGAFGKGDGLTAEPFALALCLIAKRPVRVLYSRHEDFVGTDSRHASETTLLVGFRADGTIAALRVRGVMDAGAYRGHSVPVTEIFLKILAGRAYRIDDLDIEMQVAFTNTPPAGAMRGYGGPQACYALEHLIDIAAAALSQDPLAVRQRMRIRPNDLWGGRPLQSDGLGRCLEAAARAIGWRDARATARRSGQLRRGVGIACAAWGSGTNPVPRYDDASAAEAELELDGRVHVLTAGCDLGTGLRTALVQISAEELDAPLESIRLSEMDTWLTPHDAGGHTSRSLYRNGQAVHAAAADLRRQILRYAGSKLGRPPHELELRDGIIASTSGSSVRIALAALAKEAARQGHRLAGYGEATSRGAASFIAQAVEVEVDTGTGQVRPVRMVSAADVGRAINPANVVGSIQGGAAQGIGYALTEELLVDEDTGVTLNATMSGYRVPLASEIPPHDVILVGDPEPGGPFGAKGVGELGIIPTAAAIANAVFHAIGSPMTELPMTPERVLRTMNGEA